MKFAAALITVLALLAAGCDASTPTPSASPPATAAALVSTDTLVPTATNFPTPTPGATSTTTLTPSPVYSPVPSYTPTPTVSPTATPMPTVTPYALASPGSGVGTPIAVPRTSITNTNVMQLTELARWGRGTIGRLAYSRDGRTLLVSTTTGVYVHNTALPGAAPKFIPMDGVPLLSSDGTLAATGQGVLRLSDGQELFRFPATTFVSKPLQFSANGMLLARVNGSEVEIWRMSDHVMQDSFVTSSYQSDMFAFAPNAKLMAFVSYNSEVQVVDLVTKRVVRSFKATPAPTIPRTFRSVAFSPDGKLLAIGYYLYDVDRNRTFPGVNSVEIYRIDSGERIVGIEYNKAEIEYKVDMPCGVIAYAADGPGITPPTHLEFSSDGRTLAVVYEEDYVFLYDALTGKKIQHFGPHQNAFALSPDSVHLAIAGADGPVELWRKGDDKPYATLAGYEGSARSIRFASNGAPAVVEYAQRVEVQRTSDGSLAQAFAPAHSAIARDGMSFALGYANGVIEWRRLADGLLLGRWLAHKAAIRALTFTPSGELVSTADDCTTYSWRPADGSLRQTFTTPLVEFEFTHDIGQLKLDELHMSADGAFLYGLGQPSFPYSLLAWRTSDGSSVALRDMYDPIALVAFSLDGNAMASKDQSGLKIRTVSQGQFSPPVWNLKMYSTAIAISADGTMLATVEPLTLASYKQRLMIQLHAAPDGAVLARLNSDVTVNATNPSGWPTEISFSPDGRFLALIAPDGTVRLLGIKNR